MVLFSYNRVGLVSSASNQNILILFSIPFGTAQLNPVKIFLFYRRYLIQTRLYSSKLSIFVPGGEIRFTNAAIFKTVASVFASLHIRPRKIRSH